MTVKTAATSYEARWRKNSDPADQWSSPVTVGADGHVSVPGLERVTDYTFEARAVSACGAKSAWATQTFNLPAPPAGTIILTTLASNVTAAQAAADTANAQLAAIASDNLLSPSEKPIPIRDYSVILTEHAGIDAQADAYGVSRATYDTAVSALSAYLAGLTSPTAWNDVSGNTTIDGPTFRGKFADVYAARQALLNAIYAAAKALADGAQNTANTAITQLGNLANSQYLQNPFFSTGDLTGWTSDHGSVYFESGSAGPASGSTSYAVFPHGTASEALRNAGKIPVYPGAVIKAQCAVRGVGSPNGVCGVRISWRGADDLEIGSTMTPNPSTGNATNGTYVTGTAPAGAMFAHVECATSGRTDTGGYYTVDNFAAWALADSLDQVPDGTSRFGAVEAGADKTSGKPLSSLSGRTMDYVGDSATRFAAAEAGADKTAGKSLTVLTDRTLDNVADSATYMRTVQQSHAAGAITVDNATFQNNFAGWTSANSTVYLQSTSPAPAIGAQYAVVLATAAFGGLQTRRLYACNPGDSVAVGGICYAISGVAIIQASFFAQNGTFISSISAANSSAAWTPVQAVGTVPSGAAYFTLRGVQQNSGAYALFNFVWCSINDLRVAGSGTTIGDQRNLLPLTWAGVRSVLSTSPISYSISGTTVTFTVAAFTLQGGGVNINYGAASGSVTQAAGTTTTWFLYFRDATQSGGSLPLAITSNPGGSASFPDSINIGNATVTVAAGGGGSGGTGSGGGGFCVVDSMWVDGDTQAKEASPGHVFDCCDLPTRGIETFQRALLSVDYHYEQCVRLTAANGAELDCGITTPFDTADGCVLRAPDMLGELVLTDHGLQKIVDVKWIDIRRVCYFHFGGISYAAGRDTRPWWLRVLPQRLLPRRMRRNVIRIYSHNAGTLKP